MVRAIWTIRPAADRDAVVVAAADGGEDGAAEHGGVGDRGQFERQAGDVGVDLHPQVGFGRAAADDHVFGDEAGGAHGFQDQFGAEGDTFHHGAEDVRRAVAERQAGDGSAGIGVGVGGAVALEMVQDDKAFGAGRKG